MTLLVSPAGGGWGAGGWGSSPWGGPSTGLELLNALAIRENVVRIVFSTAVYFTGVLDPGDASNPSSFVVVAVPGTFGMDEQPTRPVTAVGVRPSGLAGAQLDVTVDRPFSPAFSLYTVTAVGIRDTSGGLITPGAATQQFVGLYRELATPSLDTSVPSRDIANPQTRSALLDPLPMTDPAILGTIPVDDTGDYAFDEGITNAKKRIYRRVLTTQDGFAHLKNYGVGLANFGKRLGTVAVRQQLAAAIESQVHLEPDVSSVNAIVVPDVANPGVFRVRMLVKLSTQGAAQSPLTLDIPIGPF